MPYFVRVGDVRINLDAVKYIQENESGAATVFFGGEDLLYVPDAAGRALLVHIDHQRPDLLAQPSKATPKRIPGGHNG